MSGLVGDSHQDALRTLIDTYERVDAKVAAEAAGPADSELVVLSAPMGWGKTRVVQEFYAHLASQQQAGTPYWPSELVADVDRGPALKARKRVEPGTFEVPNSTSMPFLWWGVSCQERQDARLSNAVADDIGQLVAHFGPALNKLEVNKATRDAALGLARTLIAAAPFSDVPGILDGLDNLRTNIRDLFRAQRDRQRGDTRRIDPSGNDGSLIETWVGAIGSLLRTARIPMVVILDDAHWAGPSSIEFLDELLKHVPCLVIFTAWPDQLSIQERNEQLADAGSLIGRWEDRLTTCAISQPSDADAINLGASALGVEPSHPLAVQLAKRSHGNPLVLRLWAEIPLVQSAAQAGEALDPEDLEALPEDARAAFQRRWQDLPKLVQTVLAPTALYGTTFVPAVVAETLVAAGLRNQSDCHNALGVARDPHLWIRDLVEDTSQFTEPLLKDIAAGRASESMSTRELRKLNAAFNTSLGRLRQSQEWGELSAPGRRALLTRHHELVNAGEGGDPEGAVATYRELADLQPESETGWTEALRLINSAIELSESAQLDEDFRLTAHKTLLLTELGRSADALPICRQVLADSQRRLGPDHPTTIATRNNLAACLQKMRQPSEALPLLEQTLTDAERVLGADHPTTLSARNNLAYCLLEVGQSSEALQLFEQGAFDGERIFGTDHPTTLSARNNHATCLQKMGRSSEAVRRFERILTDRESVLGTDHPATIISLHNLAHGLEKNGQVGEALVLFEKAVAHRERVLGTDHPDTLASCVSLALCLEVVGRDDEAFPLFEKAVADGERVLGPDHPDVLGYRMSLALRLETDGRENEALSLFERILTDRERTLGPDHPDTLNSRIALAARLGMTDRVGEALPLFQQILRFQEQAKGPDHPDTITTRNNVGSCLLVGERPSESRPFFEQALTDGERVLGPNHPTTLAARNNLGNCLEDLGQSAEAARVRAGAQP